MKRTQILLAVPLVTIFSGWHVELVAQAQGFQVIAQQITTFSSQKPKIQIAILLDSSNSMDGLIDQTRSQIWQIINSLTNVQKNGQTPELEIALYHYGNDRLPAQEGFIRLLNGFTVDLDLVSEYLFSIQTDGGQEYAGWVIGSAMEQLNWSKSSSDFRAIFIAGNEPFNQGPVNFRETVRAALGQDILVNTIYCGSAESRDSNLWREGAYLAGGNHFNIDQNYQPTFIESPYDRELAELNVKLNETYIPYGESGTRGRRRQQEQDLNSGRQVVTRGYAKVSGYYRNAAWDLVDALDEGVVKLEDLREESLPEIMQGMTLAEKYEYLVAKRKERKRLQEKIRELYQLRDEYIQQQRAELEGQPNTLNSVMIEALRKQLAAKGFELH